MTDIVIKALFCNRGTILDIAKKLQSNMLMHLQSWSHCDAETSKIMMFSP